MTLLGVVSRLLFIVLPMLVVASLVIVGPRRLAKTAHEARSRVVAIRIPIAILVSVLLFRVATRDLLGAVSERYIGTYFTGYIFSLEQFLFETNPVVFLQSFESGPVTAYFSFTYVYGYVFLLVFPILAYLAQEDSKNLRALVIAYASNYAIGLLLYTLFIAYGPRNYDFVLFENLLYDTYPEVGYLTSEVNEPANVFPSLHTSLSVTVLCFAWFSRDEYPLWTPVATVLAVSIVLATMYLGIHWFTDVITGTMLAVGCVYLGRRYVERDVGDAIEQYVQGAVYRFRSSTGE